MCTAPLICTRVLLDVLLLFYILCSSVVVQHVTFMNQYDRICYEVVLVTITVLVTVLRSILASFAICLFCNKC